MRLLAPHHDDVLLSLPASLLTRGNELEVIVCFSDESDEMTDTCDALHRELGVAVTALGLPEAVRRGVSLRQCLRPLRQPSEVERDPLLGELTERLRALCDERRPLVAPLLSVHLDHALTRAAAERVHPEGLGYYVDQPYAMMHEELSQRSCAALRSKPLASGASSSAVSALLGNLRSLVGDKQITRLEASYAGAQFCEHLWFPHTETERKIQ